MWCRAQQDITLSKGGHPGVGILGNKASIFVDVDEVKW